MLTYERPYRIRERMKSFVACMTQEVNLGRINESACFILIAAIRPETARKSRPASVRILTRYLTLSRVCFMLRS